MRTITNTLAAALLPLAFVAGCEKEAGTVGAIETAWIQAELAPEGWEAAEVGGLGEASCKQGTIRGLEVVLCRYDSADAAAAAQPAGRALIGKTTGAALAEGEFLLVVADRDKADPHGKVLNQIARRFQGAAAPAKDGAAGGAEAQEDELPSWAKSAR